jgi:hypothetical protein
MADRKPAKAKLIELIAPNQTGQSVTVQFNPETLKVSYSNQVVPPKGEGSQQEKASIQYVGAGVTKLAVQIWFDVTGEAPDAGPLPSDVRKLTQQVTYFITPQKQSNGQFVPPVVRFEWGTFRYEGIMDSLEESLEFFSSDGVPLRASMSLSLSQQRIEVLQGDAASQGPPAGAGPAPGTQPLTQARAGDTLQGLAAAAGGGASWQAIASANGIENPRQLTPGQFVNLNVQASASVRLG